MHFVEIKQIYSAVQTSRRHHSKGLRFVQTILCIKIGKFEKLRRENCISFHGRI